MLTAERFAARLAQANLASKSYIANFVKKANFDIKQKMLDQTKNQLNGLSKKLKKYQK